MVVLLALACFAGGFLAISTLLRRLSWRRQIRFRAEPIPSGWFDILDRCVPLARGLAADERDQEDGTADGLHVLVSRALRSWARVLSEEYERLRDDAVAMRPSALDAYGATDKAEFFAVATETFFERPARLVREHAGLY